MKKIILKLIALAVALFGFLVLPGCSDENPQFYGFAITDAGDKTVNVTANDDIENHTSEETDHIECK